jgi:hypothetical protein
MNPSFSAQPARSWPLALALSLLLHLSLAVPIFLLSERVTGDNVNWALLDTRAVIPPAEVSVVFYDAGRPGPPEMATTSVVPRQEERMVAQPTPEPGSALEQEPWPTREAAASAPGFHSAGPATGADTTAFFQIPTQGKSIVYVIDRSGSMGSDGCLAVAKRELLASLERLPSSVRFQVIAYNRSAVPLCIHGQYGLIFATEENKQSVARLLEGIHAEGGTDHLSALKQAMALGPDVIFFLTDADELRPDEVRKVSFLNHGRSVIHAIGLGQQHGLPLNSLAQANQGVYRAVPSQP